jgi:hypothetical protein
VSIMPQDPDRNTSPANAARQDARKRCVFRFAPGIRCQMEAGHDEPYYPYLDRGQWGEYSDILRPGTPHQVRAPAPTLPPRSEWTGDERRDTVRSYPIFHDDLAALAGDD